MGLQGRGEFQLTDSHVPFILGKSKQVKLNLFALGLFCSDLRSLLESDLKIVDAMILKLLFFIVIL